MHRRIMTVGAAFATILIVAAAQPVLAVTTHGRVERRTPPAQPRRVAVRGSGSQQNVSRFQIWLRPRLVAAQNFVDAVSTPGSGVYGHYLTAAAYTRRFGATRAEVRAVREWLRNEHATDIRVSAQRDYVSADASPSIAGAVSMAVDRSLKIARPLTRRTDSESASAALPRAALAAMGAQAQAPRGLGRTQAVPTSAPRNGDAGCSRYWAQHSLVVAPAYRGISRAATVLCGYSAAQLRAAYGLADDDTGRGQTIALIDGDAPGDLGRDLAKYARANHLPAPARGQLREQINGDQSCGAASAVDAALDAEITYAMAPAAKQIAFSGDTCNQALSGQALYLHDLLMPLVSNAGHPRVSIEISSWSSPTFFGGESQAASVTQIAHAIDLRAAAEGVGMYDPAGDQPGVAVPSADPDVTDVGGTTLGIDAAGRRAFETGYSDDVAVRSLSGWADNGLSDSASGGGPSPLYSEPSYQKHVVPSAMARIAGRTGRTGPDLSADADPASGALIGQLTSQVSSTDGSARADHAAMRYESTEVGGTELAVPLVAGIIADAQQGQHHGFGFINPLLYSLADSTAFHQTLPVSPTAPQVDRAVYLPANAPVGRPVALPFDNAPAQVEVLNSQERTETDQVTTARGFDTMTGLGTPNGGALIRDLRHSQSWRR